MKLESLRKGVILTQDLTGVGLIEAVGAKEKFTEWVADLGMA